MARPVKAVQKDGPIGYQSVTVRLPQNIIEALSKLNLPAGVDIEVKMI